MRWRRRCVSNRPSPSHCSERCGCPGMARSRSLMTALRVWTRQLPLECQLCTATRQMVEFEAMKKCLGIMRKLANKMEVEQKATQKRIDDELTPVIKYHDKDQGGEHHQILLNRTEPLNRTTGAR
ncbi:unnamed protein product [Symbiodinium natans]|uniref:Uncharacterized protein n=1 Tax=Symbiodinium natans TaxID=878477 RepID=A0A812MRC7_9DINO|nr:unnamed protein product [Symbiodinium natans]